MHTAPSSERVHIGFFGLRNAGKSSLVNAVTGQALSVVSDVKGTTTDPVKKAMELLPVGPVLIIDTPGIDDEGELGVMRVEKAKEILRRVHMAVLVTDACTALTAEETDLLEWLKERNIPYVIAANKTDLGSVDASLPETAHRVSALTGGGVQELKEAIAAKAKGHLAASRRLVGDLVNRQDVVVLVTPIDEAAPKGRLILPQQQTIRDLLDADATVVVTKETTLENTLASLGKVPSLVITDSQVFGKVASVVPPSVRLTSFSILFARYKGTLEQAVEGAAALSALRDGDRVLISEGCTHHRQCGDIGTQKLPRWIEEYCRKDVSFSFTSGGTFPDDLKDYALVVHCGGCMLNEPEMLHRSQTAVNAGVPMTNYGIAIAAMHGILKRSLSPFPKLAEKLP